MHVCIIGGGVVGSSIAFRLAHDHAVDVTVVDPKDPGTGTTSVSFAWVNASNKRPRSYFDLNFAGMREYRRLANEWREAPWLYQGGCLTTQGHLADIGECVDIVRSWGYSAELLDARTVNAALEPAAQFGDPNLPIGYFPEESCVDAVALTKAFADGAASRGAACLYGVPVTSISHVGDRFALTLGDDTRINADIVVNAAGAAADKVGALLGVPVPLAPTVGLVALMSAEQHPVGRVIHTADIDVRPEGPNMLRLHHTAVDEELALGNADRVSLTTRLLRNAISLLPNLKDAHVVRSYVGVRPIPADQVSSIGALSTIPGYFEAVTHSGVTLGPLIGRLLADEIVTEKADPITDPFRPDRFIRTASPAHDLGGV